MVTCTPLAKQAGQLLLDCMNSVNGRFPSDGIGFHLPGVPHLLSHLLLLESFEARVILLHQLPVSQTEARQAPLIFRDDQIAQFAFNVLRFIKREIIQVPGNLIRDFDRRTHSFAVES